MHSAIGLERRSYGWWTVLKETLYNVNRQENVPLSKKNTSLMYKAVATGPFGVCTVVHILICQEKSILSQLSLSPCRIPLSFTIDMVSSPRFSRPHQNWVQHCVLQHSLRWVMQTPCWYVVRKPMQCNIFIFLVDLCRIESLRLTPAVIVQGLD